MKNDTKTKTLRIGIAPFEVFKARTLAIAKGEYKPNKNDPKIWFSSIESLAQILETNIIDDEQGKSKLEHDHDPDYCYM